LRGSIGAAGERRTQIQGLPNPGKEKVNAWPLGDGGRYDLRKVFPDRKRSKKGSLAPGNPRAV